MLSMAKSNGKNTLENRSMFSALMRFRCAMAVVAAAAAAVACGGGRGGGGIEMSSTCFMLFCGQNNTESPPPVVVVVNAVPSVRGFSRIATAARVLRTRSDFGRNEGTLGLVRAEKIRKRTVVETTNGVVVAVDCGYCCWCVGAWLMGESTGHADGGLGQRRPRLVKRGEGAEENGRRRRRRIGPRRPRSRTIEIYRVYLTLKLKSNDRLFIGFGGMSASPSTMFTRQYSIRAMNTNLETRDVDDTLSGRPTTLSESLHDFWGPSARRRCVSSAGRTR